MDPTLVEALKVTALPAGIVASALLASRWIGPPRCALLTAAGVAVAFAAVIVAVGGWPRVPPKQTLDLLPWLPLGGLVITACSRARAAHVATGLVAVATVCLLLGRLDLGAQQAWWTAGWIVVLGLLWQGVAQDAGRAPPVLAAMALVAGGSAGACFFSSSARLAEISGGLGSALGLVAMAVLACGCQHLARGAALAGGAALGGLLLYAWHVLDLPPLEGGLLLWGWATPELLRLVPAARRWQGRTAMVRHGLIALLPVLAALAIGWQRYQDKLAANPYS